MTTTAPGFETGRKSKTYYNTGTRDAPTLIEITRITKENFDPGEQDFAEANARDTGRKLRDEDAVNLATLSFTRLVPKGVTDAVRTALLASYGYGGTVYEFWVMDDAAGNTGAKGWRFWGKISKLPVTRDVGAFNEQQWEVKEVTHFNAAGVQEELITVAGGEAATATTTPAPTTTTAE